MKCTIIALCLAVLPWGMLSLLDLRVGLAGLSVQLVGLVWLICIAVRSLKKLSQ